MREGVQGLHQRVERQDIVVIFRSLCGELQFPAFQGLPEAEIAARGHGGAEQPMPYRDLLRDKEETVCPHKPQQKAIGGPGENGGRRADALLVFLRRVVRHLLIINSKIRVTMHSYNISPKHGHTGEIQ